MFYVFNVGILKHNLVFADIYPNIEQDLIS